MTFAAVSGRRFARWNLQEEHASFALQVVNGEIAAVGLDRLSRDGQTETEAAPVGPELHEAATSAMPRRPAASLTR